jgi:hypothetical protein
VGFARWYPDNIRTSSPSSDVSVPIYHPGLFEHWVASDGLVVPGGPFIGHKGSALEGAGFLYQGVTTGRDKRRQCGQQATSTRAL